MNIVVSSGALGEKLSVLAVRPDEDRVVEIEIPATTMVPVAGGGERLGRALWKFSQLEGERVVASVGWELLEVPVDGVMYIPNWDGHNTGYTALFPREKLDFFRLLWNRHWSFAARFRLLRFVRSLPPGRYQTIDPRDVGFGLNRVVDPGGVELITLDTEALSPQITDWFSMNGLKQEGLTVAIENASTMVGAGSRLARQLAHVGMRVVAVESEAERDEVKQGQYQVRVESGDSLESLTVRKLEQWLGTTVEVGEFDQRAEVLVVIR